MIYDSKIVWDINSDTKLANEKKQSIGKQFTKTIFLFFVMDTTSLLLLLLVCGLPFLIYVQYKNLRKLMQEGARLEKELHSVIKKNTCNKEISLEEEDRNKAE